MPSEKDAPPVVDTTPTPYVLPPTDAPTSSSEPQHSPDHEHEHHLLHSAPPYSPLSPSQPPPGYSGPLQFVFTSQDVLNSPVVDAHSSRPVYTVQSGQGEAVVTSIKTEGGQAVCDVIWSKGEVEEPRLNLDFKGKTVPLKKFMHRSTHTGVLFEVTYHSHKFEVYKAGPALGIRKHGVHHAPMLAGIRDPYKNVEIVLSPSASSSSGDNEVLPAAVIIAVLLKSKKSLGAEFEGRSKKDKVWHGVDYIFRSVGRDTVLDQGPSGGVGKDRPLN